MTKVFSLLLLLLGGCVIAAAWMGFSYRSTPLSGPINNPVEYPDVTAGTSVTYQYEYSVHGDIHESQGSVAPDLSINGVLHVRFLAADERKVILGMQLQGATIQRGNQIESFDPGMVLNELDSDGKLVGQVISKFFNEGSARFVKELFNLQVAIPADDSLHQWTVTESDSLGRYTATYKKTSSNVLHKEKRHYLAENHAVAGELKIIQSFAEINLNPTWLASYESMESIADTAPDIGAMEYTISRSVQQDSITFERTASLYALNLNASEDALKETILNQEVSELSRIPDSTARDTTFGAILIQWMESPFSGSSVANFNIEPAEEPKLLESSGKTFDDLSSEEAKFAIQALQNAQVKSKEAYSQVEKLLKHHPDEGVRMAALDFFVQDADEQYTSLVIGALDDHSKTIRLAAAQRLLESKYDSRDSVVHGLMNRLAAEDEVEVKGALYLALSPHRKSHPEIDVLLRREKASVGPELATFLEEASR